MTGIPSGILAIAPRKSTQAWSVALAMLVLVAVLPAGLADLASHEVSSLHLCRHFAAALTIKISVNCVSQTDGVAAIAKRGLWIDGNGGNPHRVGCAVLSVIDDGRAGNTLKRQVLRKRRNRLHQKHRRD